MNGNFESRIRAAFIDLHKDIDDWSENLVKSQEHYTVSFPPNSELSFLEQQALLQLNLSNYQRTGLKKLFTEHCSILISHFLTNLDGEGTPSTLQEGDWVGVNFVEAKEVVGNELSLNDIFYDSYEDYLRVKNDQRN